MIHKLKKFKITISKLLNINYFFSFVFLAGFMLFNQILIGLFLNNYYMNNTEVEFIILSISFFFKSKTKKSKVFVLKNIIFLAFINIKYLLFNFIFILIFNMNFVYSMENIISNSPNSPGDKGFIFLIILAVFYYMYFEIQKNPIIKDSELKKFDSNDFEKLKRCDPYYKDSDPVIKELNNNIPDSPDTFLVFLLGEVFHMFSGFIIWGVLALLYRYMYCLYYPDIEGNKKLITAEVWERVCFTFFLYISFCSFYLILALCLMQIK